VATEIRFLKLAKWGEAKFGHNLAVTTAEATVWSTTGLFPWADTWDLGAASCTIVSSSVADDDGGVGCNTVRVVGLGGDGILKTRDFTMDGQTPVNIGTWSMIHRANVITCGTTQRNVGTIDCLRGTWTVSTINPLDGQTEMALYRVPGGMKGYITRVWASSHDTDTADISLFTRASGEGWRLRAHYHISGGKIVDHFFPNGLLHIDPLMDIEVRAKGSNASGSEDSSS
jgi:hypothetical protein